jgi:hypothetical protein
MVQLVELKDFFCIRTPSMIQAAAAAAACHEAALETRPHSAKGMK